MANPLRSFVTFSRTERLGLIVLCALLLILITVRATMSWWVTPPSLDTAQQRKLTEAWESFKRSQPRYSDSSTQNDYQDASDENETPLPNMININTADSATLVRLRGIGPATAHRILVRREKKPFTSVDQLREVGTFRAEIFDILKKHLTVKTDSSGR